MKDDSKDATKNKPQQLTQGQQLAKALAWILDKVSFDEIKLHGSVKWVVVHLVRVAILWVWSSKRLLVESANDAIEKTEEICGSIGGSFIGSYQVLTQALIKYGDAILNRVARRIHELMEQTDEANFRIGMWLVLAVDGSRLDTPRTVANELRFCKPRKKRSKKQRKAKRSRHAKKRAPVSKKSKYNPQPVGPQVWLTLLWHVGLRMPWAWKIGPSYSSERGHFMEMLNTVNFPTNSLVCGDAGFVGYEFWKSIDSSGHRFLCRVGSNCSFLRLLGDVRQKNGIVCCWPKDQQAKGQPPLTLRLLCFNDGRGEVYLVTNELNTRNLSDKLAGQIYRKRWGIEVQVDGKDVRPKIVASTATVRRAESQIQSLFNHSQVDVFPPPGPDRRDSFFAKTHSVQDSNARMYLGIAAQGRSPKVIMLRVYLALLSGAKKAYVEAGGSKNASNPADPYMTLLGYFNSLRELGGARRLIEDEVRTLLTNRGIRRRVEEATGSFVDRTIAYEAIELTSRISTNKVSEAKRRLEQTFDKDDHVDIAIATNMISVGLDNTRLGLMVVFGQPKTSAEYIQGKRNSSTVLTRISEPFSNLFAVRR